VALYFNFFPGKQEPRVEGQLSRLLGHLVVNVSISVLAFVDASVNSATEYDGFFPGIGNRSKRMYNNGSFRVVSNPEEGIAYLTKDKGLAILTDQRKGKISLSLAPSSHVNQQ
jgi:hypothetical protein